jgi:hypothetical protein
MRLAMIAAHLRNAALAMVLLSPTPAIAQAKAPPSAAVQSAARAKAQQAIKLYGAERWQEALASFREADTLFHAPSLAVYVARCQRNLGKLLDARVTYQKLLTEDLPKDAPPAYVQAHVDAGRELEVIRDRMPTLRVVVTGAAPGEARVTLNGAPFADEKKELDPGSYTVEASARGAAPITRTITLAEGSHETVTIELHASAPASTAAPTGDAKAHVEVPDLKRAAEWPGSSSPTPGAASPPSYCRTCSIASARETRGPRGPRPGSGSRSCATWWSSTEGR